MKREHTGATVAKNARMGDVEPALQGDGGKLPDAGGGAS